MADQFNPAIVLRANPTNPVQGASRPHRWLVGVGGYLIGWIFGLLNVIFTLQILDTDNLQCAKDKDSAYGCLDIWKYTTSDFQLHYEGLQLKFDGTGDFGDAAKDGYDDEYEFKFRNARYALVMLVTLLFPQAWAVVVQFYNLFFRANKLNNGTYKLGGDMSFNSIFNAINVTIQLVLVVIAFAIYDSLLLKHDVFEVKAGYTKFQCVLAFTILVCLRAWGVAYLIFFQAGDLQEFDVIGARYEETQRLKTSLGPNARVVVVGKV
jgi:hypothetical protein